MTPKSDVPPTLGITAEARAKLDLEIEEAEKTLPSRPRPPEPPPAPIKESAFYAKVQEHLESGTVEDDGEWLAQAKQQAVMPIEAIIVGPEHREIDEEKVEELRRSIAEIGLLQPPIVTPARRLVAGNHRREACSRLGWTEIPVIIKPFDAIRGELARLHENLVRNELNAMERAEAIQKCEALYLQLHPETKIGGAPGKAGGGKRKVSSGERAACFAEETSKQVGLSRRSIQLDTQIVKGIDKTIRDRIRRSELAKNRSELTALARIKDKEEQREVAVMVLDGKAKNVADGVRRRHLRLRHEEIGRKNAESAKLEAAEGPSVFQVLLVDFPWRYSRPISVSREIEKHYETIPTSEAEDIPVEDICAQDAVMFFWCPAAKVFEACDIMRGWGFECASSMVWNKVDQGPGVWAMIEHELIIIGKRGNPPPPREGTKPRSVIHAKATEHSQKPVALYEAIEKAYPSCTRAELFARERRPGWTSFGLEIDGRDISVAISDLMKRAGIGKPKPDAALATPAAP